MNPPACCRPSFAAAVVPRHAQLETSPPQGSNKGKAKKQKSRECCTAVAPHSRWIAASNPKATATMDPSSCVHCCGGDHGHGWHVGTTCCCACMYDTSLGYQDIRSWESKARKETKLHQRRILAPKSFAHLLGGRHDERHASHRQEGRDPRHSEKRSLGCHRPLVSATVGSHVGVISPRSSLRCLRF